MPTPMMAMLHLHPSLEPQVRAGNELKVEHIDRETKTDVADLGVSRCVWEPLHAVYDAGRRDTAEREQRR